MAKRDPNAPKLKVGRKKGVLMTPNADEHKRALCEWISTGGTLAAYLRETPGTPTRKTIADWMVMDAEFAMLYARAREHGADAIADDIMKISDESPERDAQGKIDPGSVAHAKLRADNRRWLLSKWAPKRYGDKQDLAVTGADGAPLSLAVQFVKPGKEEDEA